MTPRRAPALLLPALLLSACTPSVDATDDGAQAEITAGQIVAGSSPYYWARLTWEQHQAAMAAAGAPVTDSSALVPDDDVLAVRLQGWATRLDAVMRAVTHNTAAPTPIVKVLRSAKTYNAWSSATYARLGSPVGDAAHPLPDGQTFLFSGTADGTQISPLLMTLDAMTHPAEWSRVSSFTEVWNLNPRVDPLCKLKVSLGRVLPVDPTCSVLASSSTDALVPTTSPFLTVATDLVSLFGDERAMVFTMAHELGHMYRAHTSPLTVRKYDFWYEQGPDVAKRPVPAGDSATLGLQYRALVRTPISLDKVEGASISPLLRLWPIMAAYFTEQAQAQNPQLAIGLAGCAGYPEWVQKYGTPTSNLTAMLNAELPTPEISAAYLALEPVFTQCASAHFSPGRTEVGGIDSTWVESVLSATRGLFGMPAEPGDNETIAAYLARGEAAAAPILASAEMFRQRLNTNHIGMYTIEQEADEVAMELMVRAGYTREDVLQGWTQFGLAFDAKFPPGPDPDTGRASTATCSAWMQNGFRALAADGTMQPVIMTLGDLSDNHHGDCYRLYNLWRESKTHKYGASAPQVPLSPDWATIQKHAADLTAEAAAAGI